MIARDAVSEENRWNVEALYPSIEAWRQEFSGMKWQELASFKGALNDPQKLKQFLTHFLAFSRKLEKLYTYIHLRFDEDLGNDKHKTHYGEITSLYHEFALETSWVEPELLSLPADAFTALLKDPSLQDYRFYLEKMGRMRPHTLSADKEELMALSGKALSSPSKAFSALNNADMVFPPAIDSQGKEQPLTNGSYLSYMRSPDRALRKTAFENLHRAYEAHANTVCELLQGHVQSHLFNARARGYKSCLEAALFPNQINREVYEALIKTVRAHLPLLHDYIALRKKMLGLSEIHAYDLSVPLVDEPLSQMEYRAAVETVVASVAPLGKEYQDVLRQGLMKDRWVDPFENGKKRSGAYSSGCYDSMPYILMNYHGTLNDVLTLAHEAGHSMHSYLSRKNQPYIYADYPIFVAEVASTFNEQLLLKELKKKGDSPFLTNYQIEGIRGTIFRQTMFAEFELTIHKFAEEGRPLTPQLLKDTYTQLNRDYYGPDFVIDPELSIEWARIPHFYYNFYVYQYATGLSAALALFQKMEVPSYLTFLSSGGSKFPLDLLKGAGADLTTPAVVESAMTHFKTLVNSLRSSTL